MTAMIRDLDWEIRLGTEFLKCKSEDEVIWLKEQFESIIECLSDERLEELENE